MSTPEPEINHAKQNAANWLDNIVEMVQRLEHADSCTFSFDEYKEDKTVCDAHDEITFDTEKEYDEYHDLEDAERAINDSPLSVQVRSDWEDSKVQFDPYEYNILLSTGGPALRIYGQLDQYNQPDNADLQYQDWFTPWESYYIEDDEKRRCLLEYARRFYFGE
jgi:hypothetical protein